jgi:asparagine synthase (glutamine-hydrolysing)
MCGLLGVIGANRQANQAALDAALDLLSHRGPDDRGTFSQEAIWLGLRRLAIIDLTAAGHQPMIDTESGCVIVFNGEIYNYLELKAELQQRGHVFRTASDTEVLIKAYLEWKEDCLSRLNGMWAFAIWDPRRNEVFLARDRFGVKPLYYTERGGCISFASEPKALLQLYPDLRTVNRRTLYRFIAYGELYTENESFYSGIHLLPPASFAFVPVDNPRVAPRLYWTLQVGESVDWSKRDPLTEFSALFESAVSLRLRSDVPVGLALSGGIDSSAILSPMAQALGGNLTCLTTVYGRRAEAEFGWATMAAVARNVRLVPVEAPCQEWLNTMKPIAWHMDAPGYSSAVYPTWKLMGAAKSLHIPVMLEGQGADEAFAGYAQYAAIFLLSILKRGQLRTFTNQYRKLIQTFPGNTLLFWMLRETLPRTFRLYRRTHGAENLLRRDAFDGEARAEPTASHSAPAGVGTPLTKRLYSDYTRTILPGLLHYGDAISMGQSIESRLPFMDYRLAEWIFSAPDNLKIDDGSTKVILRNYLKKIGLASIAQRRDKQGYRTPVVRWLTANGGALAKEILLAPDSRILEYCSEEAISKLIDRHLSGASVQGDNLYKLVSTEFWLRACITK